MNRPETRQAPAFYRRNCVIVSSIDWSDNWQIHQLLANSLVDQGHRVLFIENTGMRAPRQGDYGRVLRRLRNWKRSLGGFRDIRPHLSIFSPLFLPYPYSRTALLINRLLLSSVLRVWRRINRFHDPVVISFLPTPLAQALTEDMNPELVIYYCADNMAAGSEGARAAAVHEQHFMKSVAAVYCTAENLVAQARKYNPNVLCLPAGVDLPKFTAALETPRPPADLAHLTSPIIGYVGSIRHILDQDLLVYLANAIPEASFVFVGPEFTDVNRLRACPNIHLFGARAHDTIPDYIQCFDAALIPYEISEFTAAIYTCKVNEYLAMGVPVVATGTHELQKLVAENGPVVSIADTPETFLAALRAALQDKDPAARATRQAVAARNSWASRFAEINADIDRHLQAAQTGEAAWQERWLGLYQRIRRRWALLVLTGALVYGGLWHTPALYWAGDALVQHEAPAPADAIVVFSGDGEPGYVNMGYQKRVLDALALYRGGYAPRILLSSGKGQRFAESEVIRALLIEQGIPAAAIHVTAGLPASTQENVALAHRTVQSLGARNILFVTAPYHSLRASLVWKKTAPQLKVTTVTTVDKPQAATPALGRLDMLRVMAFEYAAIAYYWLRGWL